MVEGSALECGRPLSRRKGSNPFFSAIMELLILKISSFYHGKDFYTLPFFWIGIQMVDVNRRPNFAMTNPSLIRSIGTSFAIIKPTQECPGRGIVA